MTLPKTALSSIAFFALVTAPSLRAALVVYEPFNYSAGVLGSATSVSDIGWSATEWTTAKSSSTAGAEFNVSGSGLSFTGLPTSGGAAVRLQSVGRASANRQLAGASVTTLTGASSAWFSILVNTDGGGEDFDFTFGSGTHTTDSSETFSAAGDAFGISVENQSLNAIVHDNSATASNIGSTLTISSGTYLIAGQISWNTGTAGADVFSLYNITDPTAALPTAFATGEADLTDSSFTTISFWDRLATSQQFDEIRLGTSFAGVMGQAIPEPHVALLGGLGVLLLLRRRR